MRALILIAAIALFAAGCGSHHNHAAAEKRQKVTYVLKLVPPPGCRLSPLPTRAELRRFIRRCGHP